MKREDAEADEAGPPLDPARPGRAQLTMPRTRARPDLEFMDVVCAYSKREARLPLD